MRHGYTRRRCLMFATSTHKYTLALWQIWLRCRARANGRSCCQEGKEGGTTAAEMCVCKKRSSRKKTEGRRRSDGKPNPICFLSRRNANTTTTSRKRRVASRECVKMETVPRLHFRSNQEETKDELLVSIGRSVFCFYGVEDIAESKNRGRMKAKK